MEKTAAVGSCRICHVADNKDYMLMCRLCCGCYHLPCFRPSLKALPQGHWHCDVCEKLRKGKDCGDIKCEFTKGSQKFESVTCRSRPFVDLKPEFSSRVMLSADGFDFMIGKSLIEPGDSAFSLQLEDSVHLTVVPRSQAKSASDGPLHFLVWDKPATSNVDPGTKAAAPLDDATVKIFRSDMLAFAVRLLLEFTCGESRTESRAWRLPDLDGAHTPSDFIAALIGMQAVIPDSLLPAGSMSVEEWQRNVRSATSFSQLSTLLKTLDSCVNWNENNPDIFPCRRCYQCDEPEKVLVCDACANGYHLQCLQPPLKEMPKGSWFCEVCKETPNVDCSGDIVFIIGPERHQVAACRNQPICELKDGYASQTKLAADAFEFFIGDRIVQPDDTANSLNLRNMVQISVMKAPDTGSASLKSANDSQALLVEQWKSNKAEIAARWIKYCKKEGISLSEAFRGALLSLVVPRLLSSSKPYGHPRWQMWLKDLKVVPNVDATDFMKKKINARLDSKAFEVCQAVDILNLLGVYFSQKLLAKKDCKAVLVSLIELYVVATEQHSAKDAQKCFVDGFYERYGLSATQESIDPERFFEDGIRTPLISALFMLCLSYAQMMIDVFGHSRCIINDIKEQNVPTAEMLQYFDRFDCAIRNQEFEDLFLIFLRISEQRPLNARCQLTLCNSHTRKKSEDYAGNVFVSRAFVSTLCEVGQSASERVDHYSAASVRFFLCEQHLASADAVKQAEIGFALSWLHSNRSFYTLVKGVARVLGSLEEKLIRIRCERRTNAENVSKQQASDVKKDNGQFRFTKVENEPRSATSNEKGESANAGLELAVDAEAYFGSEKEKEQIKQFYVTFEGNTDVISAALHYSFEDEERMTEIIMDLIAANELPRFDSFAKHIALSEKERKHRFDQRKKDSAKVLAEQSCKSTTASEKKATEAKQAVCTEKANELRGGSAEDMPKSKRTNNKPVKQVGQLVKSSVTSETNEPSSSASFFGSREDCNQKAKGNKGDKKASGATVKTDPVVASAANNEAVSDRAVAGGGDLRSSIDPGPRLCGSEAKLFAELERGSAALLKADFEEAFRHYSAAFQLTQSEASLTTCEHEWYSLAVFAYVFAYVSSNTVQLSQQTVKNVLSILESVEQSITRFPLVYYGKALINFKTNDFANALSELENVSTILDNNVPLRPHCWPTTKIKIAESDPTVLKERSAALNKQCRNAPRPTAVCHSSAKECIKCGYTRQAMYVSDVNFAGFIRLTCQSKCKIDWHPNCFKTFMKNSGYSEPRDLEGSQFCFTPDCGSELEVIEWFRGDLIKSKTIKLTTGKKAAKQRQPIGEAAARGRQLDKAANKEPVNADANRRRSVSMKTSFTSADQDACSSENAVSTGSFDIEDEEDLSRGSPPTSDLVKQLQSENERLLANKELLEARITEIQDSFAKFTNERKGLEAELKRNQTDRKTAEESSKRISDLEQDVERWKHKATQIEIDFKKADQERKQLKRKVDELQVVKKDQSRLDVLTASLQEDVNRSIANEVEERSRAVAAEVQLLKLKREYNDYKRRLAVGRADQHIRFTRNRLDWYFENKFHKFEQPCRDHISQWDAYKRKLEQIWTTFSAAIDRQINDIEHVGLPLCHLPPVEMGAFPEEVADLSCPSPFVLIHEASLAAASANGQLRNGPSFAPSTAAHPLFPPPPMGFPFPPPMSAAQAGALPFSFAHPSSVITMPSTAMPSQRASPSPFFDDHQFYHGGHHQSHAAPSLAHQSAGTAISGAFSASSQPNIVPAGPLPRTRAAGASNALQFDNQPGSNAFSRTSANRLASNEQLPSTNAMRSNPLQPKTLQQAAASLHHPFNDVQPNNATGLTDGVDSARGGELPPPLFGSTAASRFASRAISPNNLSDDDKKRKRAAVFNHTIARVRVEIEKHGIFLSDKEIKDELIALDKKDPVEKKPNVIYTRLVAHLTQNAPGSGPMHGPSGGQAASGFGAAAAAAPSSASFDKDDCSICLEDLANGQPTTRNICGHVHHSKCLAEWQKTNQSCPKCRALALPQQDYPPLH